MDESTTERVHELVQDPKTKDWRCPICGPRIYDGCPMIVRYSWFDDPKLPETYRTKTQLDREGLKPGAPRAYIYWERKDRLYVLYELSEARPKKQATLAQLAALEKARETATRNRRTCPCCKQVRNYEISIDREYGKMCDHCRQAEEDAFHEGNRQEAKAWARKVMAQRPVILDTETTGLGDAGIVQIGVLDADGTVLMDTLVNPERPIEPGAQAVHKITDEMASAAPAFSAIMDQLQAAIAGRVVIVYGLSFDYNILRNAVERHYRPAGDLDWETAQAAYQRAEAWMKTATWEDAMDAWAIMVGDWSDHHGDYRWQRLPGGDHTAIGDCRAALEIMQYMAAEPAAEESGDGEEAPAAGVDEHQDEPR